MDKDTRRFYPLEQNPSLDDNEIQLGDVTQVPRKGKSHYNPILGISMIMVNILFLWLSFTQDTRLWLIPMIPCTIIGLRASIKPKH